MIFGAKLGWKIDPTSMQKRVEKNDQKMKDNKMTQKSLQVELRRGDSLYGGLRPGPGAPWGGGKGEGWINGSEPTNLTRQWARGPAN